MDYSAIALYFAAVVAYTVSPGPMMAVIIARTLGRDSKGAAAIATGFCAGFVIAVLAVALGIGVWAQSRPDILSLGKYFGVAYLLWLAVGMWNGRSSANSAASGKGRLAGVRLRRNRALPWQPGDAVDLYDPAADHRPGRLYQRWSDDVGCSGHIHCRRRSLFRHHPGCASAQRLRRVPRLFPPDGPRHGGHTGADLCVDARSLN